MISDDIFITQHAKGDRFEYAFLVDYSISSIPMIHQYKVFFTNLVLCPTSYTSCSSSCIVGVISSLLLWWPTTILITWWRPVSRLLLRWRLTVVSTAMLRWWLIVYRLLLWWWLIVYRLLMWWWLTVVSTATMLRWWLTISITSSLLLSIWVASTRNRSMSILNHQDPSNTFVYRL